MLRIPFKILGGLVGFAVLFIAAIAIGMCIVNSPEYARRVLMYGESDTNDYLIFPERAIKNGDKVSTLETAYTAIPQIVNFPYKGEERSEQIEELLKRTDAKAFIVIRDDEIIYERYFNGSTRDSINTSFSAAKSFDSALIGAAIMDGRIRSVEDAVIEYIPEIAGHGFDDLTIRDLLMMNSGIRYRHNDELPFFLHPFGDDAFTYYSSDLRKIALSVEASETPIGEAFRYNNFHPLLEGLIVERVTCMHVAKYLQEKFWRPMGAEFAASWSLDSERSGFEKMESGINARAIDYARFGLIYLHDGYWNGVQILSESWVRESTEPLQPDPRTWETMTSWPSYSGYYKYHWWGINNADGTYDFYAHGKYDQIVYVAPRKNAVIVRLGNSTDENVRWPLVIHDLIDQLP
jgi:CubicO group peptidase (beta-lactamase class C family)